MFFILEYPIYDVCKDSKPPTGGVEVYIKLSWRVVWMLNTFPGPGYLHSKDGVDWIYMKCLVAKMSI